MTALDRRQFILDRLDQQEAWSYGEIAESLGVSTMTVRRDLAEPIRQGAVIRTVGGIQRVPAPSYLHETALQSRLTEHRREKRAIARRALEMVPPNSTLFVDGSTTCLELARLIARERKGLTVVTNSALACLELGKGGDNAIVGIGGHYDANSLCFVGPQAEDSARALFVEIAFVSTKAFLPAAGTYESSPPTFRIKQIIARQASQVVLLVDHSKFGLRALRKVLDIGQIHTVVTDPGVGRKDLGELEKSGRQTLIAASGQAA